MGLGRNTIFLAQKGWDATGIDLSEVGVAKAQKRASSLGMHIKALVADVNRFDLGTDQWDLICLLYFVIHENMPNRAFELGINEIESAAPGIPPGCLRLGRKWSRSPLATKSLMIS